VTEVEAVLRGRAGKPGMVVLEAARSRPAEGAATCPSSTRGSVLEGRRRGAHRDESPRHPCGRSSRSSGRRRAESTTLLLDKWVPPQPHLSQGKSSAAAAARSMVLPLIVAYGRRFQGAIVSTIAGIIRRSSVRETEMRTHTTAGARSARPETVIGSSGMILLVLSFVPWWGTITTSSLSLGESGRLPSASGRFNAHFGYGWILELAVILGAAAAILAIGRRVSAIQLPRWLYLWIGLIMTILVLASIVRGPASSGFEGVSGIEVSRGPLVVVAIVPCALITVAGLGFARNQRKKRR